MNLEFDHADIFNSIDDIRQQFQNFIQLLPSSGSLIANLDEEYLQHTVADSAVTPLVQFSISGNRDADWYADSQTDDYRNLMIHSRLHGTVELSWNVPGRHNAANGSGGDCNRLWSRCWCERRNRCAQGIQTSQTEIGISRQSERGSDIRRLRSSPHGNSCKH